MKIKGISQVIMAILCLCISLYGLAWIFSSASLASGYCGSEFSLLHPEFRCKQPYIALAMFITFSIGFILLSRSGIKNINDANNRT
ncbi:MAG: hypothetical protein V7765_17770 [Oleispira sp.]